MSWHCPKCNLRNVNYNEKCASCKSIQPAIYNGISDDFSKLIDYTNQYLDYKSLGLEQYEIDSIHRTSGASEMTPEEELYKELFSHETILVSTMDTLTLRAHIEQLSKIAKEAKIRYYAATEYEKKSKKVADGKPTGFARSVNTDETTTNAINAVKDRQKRLTKQEKMAAGFAKLGISQDAINKLMSNGNILAALANKNSEEIKATEKPEYKPETAKVFNPFEKK